MRKCCQGLVDANGTPSPFRRAVSFGYYDGSTSGVAQCDACDRAYRYVMLAADEDLDVRAFGLAELPGNAFDRVLAVCSRAFGQPTWPMWSPIWRFRDPNEQHSTEKDLDAILEKADAVGVVCMADDILGVFQKCKRLSATETFPIDRPDKRNWLSLV